MYNAIGIFKNSILWCAVLAWALAQLIKFFTCIIKERRVSPGLLIASGGMPSSHTSTVCALATAVGMVRGFNTAECAIAVIVAFIVMYDASGVRRAAGEQAKILNMIMEDLEGGNSSLMNVHLKELIGHTPLQVFAGALLGIAVPIAVYFFTGKL